MTAPSIDAAHVHAYAATVTGQHGAALRWKLAHLGEHEIPMGSNTGPFVLECQRATWLAGTGWPWCVASDQAAWAYGAGRALPWRGAGAYAFLDWALRVGWAAHLNALVPGDEIVWNVGAGHASMLALPYAETTPNVVTVDGNVGDAVRLCSRPSTLARGGIHVPERPAKTHAKLAPKTPRRETVTSHSGHAVSVHTTAAAVWPRSLKRALTRA